jgi:IS1 family transposase
MAKAKSIGQGWHFQTERHSNARRTGHAGGHYLGQDKAGNKYYGEFMGGKLDVVRNKKDENTPLLRTEDYFLEPRFDSRKDFYKKAKVELVRTDDMTRDDLYSYGTKVASIRYSGGEKKLIVYGTYSATTLRHIKEFLKQNGFKAENSKQIMKDYSENPTPDKIPKTVLEFSIQGNYGGGFEDVITEDNYKDARTQLKCYNDNEKEYAHRIVKRRVPNPKFKPNADADGDGVKNSVDCKPLDAKEQGWLHDKAEGVLRKMEAKQEAKRLAEMKKLEDLKEKLQEANAQEGQKNDKLKQKQAIINEIEAEKKKTQDLRKENSEIREELNKNRVDKKVLRKSKEFFAKPSTKKAIKKGLKNVRKELKSIFS